MECKIILKTNTPEPAAEKHKRFCGSPTLWVGVIAIDIEAGWS